MEAGRKVVAILHDPEKRSDWGAQSSELVEQRTVVDEACIAAC